MTEAQYKCVNIRWKNMSLEVDIQISKYQLKQYESRNWITKSQGAWGTCNQCLWQAAAVSRRHLNQSPLSPVPSCCSNIDQHSTFKQSMNQLRRYLLPADGNVRRRPTTVDRRPFPFQGGRQILTSKWEWSQTIFNPLHVCRQQMQADTGQQAAAFSTTRRRRS